VIANLLMAVRTAVTEQPASSAIDASDRPEASLSASQPSW
jgi:hypothetical protein